MATFEDGEGVCMSLTKTGPNILKKVISRKPLHYYNGNLITNMTASNNSQNLETKFDFLRLIPPEMYSMQKYDFFSPIYL